MKLIRTKNYEEMSRVAAMFFIQELVKGYERKINVGITAGSTPIRMYEIMQAFLKENEIPNVHYYNFDEIPLKHEKEGVTMRDLRKLFFTPCMIKEKQIHYFNEHNYQTYDTYIQKEGGLDFLMMGLGKDGHFCGNLSGTLENFDCGCRAVDNCLNKTLEERIAFLCGGKENMTEYYVTFGPKTLMHTKRLVMIASGKEKAEIVKSIVTDKINVLIPSTLFQLHPDFTLIADDAALSLLETE